MRITFKRTSPRTWSGNGMGYQAADYLALVNGVPTYRIVKVTSDWRIYNVDDGALRGSLITRLVDAKDAVRKLAAEAQPLGKPLIEVLAD